MAYPGTPKETVDKIILFWKTEKDKRSKVIAKKFGMSVNTVNSLLDNYLKSKRK